MPPIIIRRHLILVNKQDAVLAAKTSCSLGKSPKSFRNRTIRAFPGDSALYWVNATLREDTTVSPFLYNSLLLVLCRFLAFYLLTQLAMYKTFTGNEYIHYSYDHLVQRKTLRELSYTKKVCTLVQAHHYIPKR